MIGLSRTKVWGRCPHRTDKRGGLGIIRPIGLASLDRAGDLLVAGGPERMLLAAVLIGIALSRNLFPRSALALLERIGIGCHDRIFRTLDLL
jgi:hypothetical protein